MEECKKVLTWEQKIQNIESAPEEARLMIAKAYIRDDIPDENVQYEFNTDSPEQLNEDGEIENLNADDPEGIGATGFTMRTTRPANNKNFITRGSGGWNTCIKGNPRYQYADALANCVGYASGRFNEIINIARETTGCTYTTLNCNAVGFKERAEAAGLKTGSTPRRGAIMCWGKEGGAGHVAIVERVNNSNSVYTSESGWGSSAIFWNSTRNNNNGRWGIGTGYYFRCFIYLPDDVQKAIDAEEPTPTPQPTPSDKFNIGDKVVINGPLYVSSTASSPAGHVSNKVTNITRKNPGSAHPYNTTGDLGWMDESSIKKYEEPTPAPTPTPAPSTELNVGDAVEIIDTGNGSAYGGSNTAYGIGWKRQILKIWNGKPYPYQVGNNTGTTGFYKKEALKKI
jgi:surface antigen